MSNNNLTGPPACHALNILANEDTAHPAVASTGIFYSKSFNPIKNCSFGTMIQFSSPGVVNVKVELEQGLAAPGTEGSADTTWGVGDTLSAGIVDTNPHPLVASPVVMPFCRYKLTGLGSNDAATAIAQLAFTYEKNL